MGWARVSLIAFSFWALLFSTSVLAQDTRTWTDSTGKFKIQAKFLSLEGGKVTLERDNGTKVSIDLAKLSAADQKVANELAESPFQPADDSPFEDDFGGSGASAENVEVDWSSVRDVPLAPQNDGWSITIGEPPSRSVDKPRSAIPLPPKADFFEGTKGLVVNDAAGMAAIAYVLGRPGQNEHTTRLLVCSFADRGKVVAKGTFDGAMSAVALSPDGSTILMRRDEFGFGNQDRLELWKVAGANINRAKAWVPYGDLNGGERDVKWADFVGPDKLITISGSGKIALWNLENMQPEYTLAVQGGTVPALSPDDKYLVYLNNEDMGVLDVQAGEVVAVKAAPKTPFPVLSFSSTGKRFACAGMDKLFVFETANGEQIREILLTTTPANGQLLWTSDSHVLLGGHYLVDIESQVPLWEYQGNEFAAADRGPVSFVVSEGEQKPGALITATLPQAGVEDTLKKAMADPDFFVLKPGVTVRLNVDALPDPQERENARASLTQKLQELGIQVGANGTLDLVASTEQGEPREITYRTFGFGFGEKTYTVREHFVRLKFIYQGKPAWESGSGSIPGFINLQEGETVEQVLRKHERPNYTFFQHVQLPKLLIKPTGRATLGMSRVSVAGIR